MYKKMSRVAIAAAALALAVGAARAATPADAPPQGAPAMHHHMDDGGPFGAIRRMHDKLNLNAAQEQQWQTALAAMKQRHEAMRKSHEALHQQMRAQQNQPILDLNALHAARQQAEQQNAQLREQSATAWLAFYNGLNDQQKTLVSTALKQQFARMEQRHEKMKQRWEQHREAGKTAPAPASAQ